MKRLLVFLFFCFFCIGAFYLGRKIELYKQEARVLDALREVRADCILVNSQGVMELRESLSPSFPSGKLLLVGYCPFDGNGELLVVGESGGVIAGSYIGNGNFMYLNTKLDIQSCNLEDLSIHYRF